MKLLIIPGLPIAAIYLSHAMAYLPLPLPIILILTFIILLIGSALILRRLITSRITTYLYGTEIKGTSLAPPPQEYCRHQDGTKETIGPIFETDH
jgi:hypothetical protein